MIQPTYVTFKQAVALKEKGFDIETTNYYTPESGKLVLGIKKVIYPHVQIKAPEQWMIVEWVFQKYRYSIEAELNIPELGKNDGCYIFNGILKGSEDYKLKTFYKSEDYPTKEKAISDVIDKILNMI